MRRRWRWMLAATIVMLVVLAFAALPLLSLLHLKDALEARDAAAVRQLVDFPRLKANVEHATHRKIDRANRDSLLAPVVDVVSKTIADIRLDQLATPEGLIHLVCDSAPDGSIDSSVSTSAPCTLKGHLRSIGYASFDRFTATVQPDHGDRFEMIFVRDQGVRWRLVDLR